MSETRRILYVDYTSVKMKVMNSMVINAFYYIQNRVQLLALEIDAYVYKR